LRRAPVSAAVGAEVHYMPSGPRPTRVLAGLQWDYEMEMYQESVAKTAKPQESVGMTVADDPAHDLNDDYCIVCKGAVIDDEPKEPLYCCDTCSRSFHAFCIKDLYAPNWTADDLPSSWHCHFCTGGRMVEGDGGGVASSRDADREANTASKKKRKPHGRR